MPATTKNTKELHDDNLKAREEGLSYGKWKSQQYAPHIVRRWDACPECKHRLDGDKCRNPECPMYEPKPGRETGDSFGPRLWGA